MLVCFKAAERPQKISFRLKSFAKFDEHLIQLSGGAINMSVIEIVKKQEREQGMLLGRKEERAKAEAEKLGSALNFKKMGVPVEDIAKGLGLSIEQVEKL